MIEKLENIVSKQVEAIKNIKIDKITVWDSGTENGSGTANFMSSMIKAIPPLQDVAAMAGVQLPEYLGKMTDTAAEPKAPEKPNVTVQHKAQDNKK
jgi:flotillin